MGPVSCYYGPVSRYRLYPDANQEKALLTHCEHARYVWNLALEVFNHGTRETYGCASRKIGRDGRSFIHQKRRPVAQQPGYMAQARQLTEARDEFEWLRAGSQMVQQQALRDFDTARGQFLAGTHGYPTRRKKWRNEGFRIVGLRGKQWDVRRVSRKVGQVRIPKVGWVRFRWSRAVPDAKSYRVTLDRAGRWHVAFAAIPAAIPGPGTGEVVGVDRGVAITAALSTGEILHCPGLGKREQARLRKAHRRAERAPNRSADKQAEYAKIARIHAHDADRRKDWVQKTSTDLARRFDVIRIEDLRIRNMTGRNMPRLAEDGTFQPNGAAARAGLNRAILAQGWGQLAECLESKAAGRVQKVPAAYTSLRCSGCGWIDKNSRKSQAEFACSNCGFTCNADTNASLNIAAGYVGGATRREPLSVRELQVQLTLSESSGIPALLGQEDANVHIHRHRKAQHAVTGLIRKRKT